MKAKNIFLALYLTSFTSTAAFAQYEYNWATATTASNTDERIVAIIDAGTVGPYDGIGIIGEVVDDNGNWGQRIPIRSDFNLNVRFSAGPGLGYQIVQERKTHNIILRLRKISNSKFHLTAYLPNSYKAVSVSFDVVVSLGIDSVTIGSTSVPDSSGELVISEPTYESIFDGNVGIGTTSPDHELTVVGTINSQEIIVEETAGADFVFQEDYELPTLEEIEAFIGRNRHLPGIAPASEMIEEGVKVGELQMQLLQKIEELTLHTISQEKKIQTQQGENEELKLMIDNLIRRIQNLENEN